MVALTLTNPATILSFAALFASIGAGTGGAGGAAAVVAGVFLGSVAWWAILTGVVAGLRARLTPRAIRGLNVASAVIIGGFGIAAIVLGLMAGAERAAARRIRWVDDPDAVAPRAPDRRPVRLGRHDRRHPPA